MSNDYDDDDYGQDIPDLRKAHRAAAKRVKELEAELAEARSANRVRTVKDVLTQRGVNTKIAALIPADVQDEDGVAKWLDDYADVFGIVQAAEDAAPATPGVPNGMTAADVEAFAAINQAGSGRPIEAEADLEARIKSASSPQELAEILRGAGVG
jgi:hypothetical protein